MKSLPFLFSLLLLCSAPALAGEGCDHGEPEATRTPSGESDSCHGEEHADSTKAHGAGSACPMKGKTIAETTEVTLEGKLLCRRCNLHETESCEKVFQTTGSETLLPLCPASELADAEKLSEHGEALIVVTGKRMTASDGTVMLRIASAKSAS